MHSLRAQAIFAPLVAVAYAALINLELLFTGHPSLPEAATVMSHPAGVWAITHQPDISTPEVRAHTHPPLRPIHLSLRISVPL